MSSSWRSAKDKNAFFNSKKCNFATLIFWRYLIDV